MVGWVFGVAGFLVATLVVIVVSHRTLTSAGRQSSGMADAFGNFIDVFDPGQARAERDLKSQEHQGAIIPSLDDDDRPMRIIESAGRRIVRIRRQVDQRVTRDG